MVVVLVGVLVFAGAGVAVASGGGSAGCSADDGPTAVAGPETVHVLGEVMCRETSSSASDDGSIFATMAHSLRFIAPLDNRGSGLLAAEADVDLCSLPGGSDLPGAKLTYEFVLYKPGPTREFTFDYTLPDDRAAPLLRGGSNPPHGTTVQAGDTIKIHITASEPTNKGAQEGIEDIQLMGPDGLIDSADYGKHPIACDRSRLSKTLTTTYTVPENPPAVIHLTAIAHDFAGNESIPLSADFPTGHNAWTVSFDLDRHNPTCPETEIGTGTLTVAANGTVQGTTSGNYTSPGTCRVPYGPAGSFTGFVTGTFAANQFDITFFMSGVDNAVLGTPLTVPLTSSTTASASGTDQQLPAGIYRTYTVTLKRAG
jgi:hypothetical protein